MPPTADSPLRPRYLTRSQRKLLFVFLQGVIMLLVIAIFLFFLGFAAIVLLHFLFMSNTFNRRCSRLFQNHPHHRHRHGNGNAAEDEDAAAAPADPPLLPDVAYSAAAFSWVSDCAICLESFVEGDECRNIPACKHLFHAKCLGRWIRKNPTCPACRTRVDLDPIPGLRACGDEQWKRLWAVNLEQGTSP
ncbi:RING-H2 finger protein ATL56-like [Andrographis paniculata]|uniref:RING-H2 finger protein ATL56-like n=1 Tax=Andrographis paniculata TaxID=175694 RepID=UPI0021E8317D|nr:RING-H2 finger protein ATL56-like [Andrographis paniculata]XP_051142717.1 RING-H2 finger protein ATL56-like [Andrographis paniculata]XP_051142739.1 RING-H2 finger protein ATL56-like [Andrographis paniculata]